jgi:ABC-type transporter Mla subunit MlaD
MNFTHLRVGVMLLASLGLAVGLVLFLGRNRVSDGLRFETYFRETVQGMDVGSPVRFRGVQLGQVTEMMLASAAYPESAGSVQDTHNRLVVVRFVVDPAKLGRVPETGAAVRAGLRARLAAQGITGLVYMELDFVADVDRARPVDYTWQPSLPVIPSAPSTISQVRDAAEEVAAKLRDVDVVRLANSLQGLLDDARGQIGGGELRQTLAEAALLLKTLRGGVEAADIPGLATELRDTVAALRTLAGGEQSRELIAATTKTAERLSEAVTRLPALIANLETAVRRVNNSTADAQSELLPALRDARAAAASLRDTTETLRRYPGSVLSAPPPRERR